MVAAQTSPRPDTTSLHSTMSYPSLYVGDLDPTVSETVLVDTFQKIGELVSVRICRDRLSQNSLGYGYVNYTNFNDAERALETLNYSPINGKPIRLMWSHRDPRLRKSGAGNIFIKNLPKSIDNKALHDICSTFGNILSCKVALDASLQSKGHGFVHFDKEEAADAAINALNMTTIKDSVVHVGHFVKKSERPPSDVSYTNLYIKNFPSSWDEKTLRDTFSTFGTITSLAIRSNAKQQRFAFINFELPTQANAAIEALHGKKFKDDIIVMEEEEEQTHTENDSKDQSEETFYVQPHQEKHQRQAQLKAQHASNTNVNGVIKSRTQGSNLYIKNFDSSVDDEALRNMFSLFGPISSAVVMRDDKGESLGFGFVNYVSHEDGVRAVTEMNNNSLNGKPLYVSTHEPKDVRKKRIGASIHQNARNPAGNHNMYQPTYNGTPMHPPYGGQPTGNTPMTYRQIPSMNPGMNQGNIMSWRGSGNNNFPPPGVPMRPTMNPIPMFPGHTMISATPPHQASAMPNNGVMMGGTPTPPNTSAAQQLPSQTNINIQSPNAHTNSSPNTSSSPVGNNTTTQQPQQPTHTNNQQQSPLMPTVGTGNINQPNYQQGRVGPHFSSPLKKANTPNNPNFGAGYKFTTQVRNQIEPPNKFTTVMDTNTPMMANNNTTGVTMMPSSTQPNNEVNNSHANNTISYQQLNAMSSSGQKQYLGEQLFYRIMKIQPELAGKITGMMLEMENEELLSLLSSDSQLNAKVQEALRVLQTHIPTGPN